MWLSAIKLAVSAGSKIYENKQLQSLCEKQILGGKMVEKNKKDLNHEMFTNKDGYVEGGIEIKGTRRIRPDKKPVKATWY